MEDVLQGVVHVGEEDEPRRIEDIYKDVLRQALNERLKIVQKPVFKAIPLFPDTSEGFNDYFVDKDSLKIKNKQLFTKRINGLVS